LVDRLQSLFHGDSFNVYARIDAHASETLTQPISLWGLVDGESTPRQLAHTSPAFMADEGNSLARLAAHTRYMQLKTAATNASTAGLPQYLTLALPELAEKYQLVTDDTSFVLVKERAEGEQAQEMPELHQVSHMLAAGWGGLGSVVVTESDSVAVPSVWKRAAMNTATDSGIRFRTVRSSALNQSNIDPFSLDDIDIPAFLRRQTDDGWNSHDHPSEVSTSRFKLPARHLKHWTDTPSENSDGLMTILGWTPQGYAELLSKNTNHWPQSYADLRSLRLSELVVLWLQLVIGETIQEELVVQAFNRVMEELIQPSGGSLRGMVKVAVAPFKTATPGGESEELQLILDRIRRALTGITPQEWPQQIVQLEEADHV